MVLAARFNSDGPNLTIHSPHGGIGFGPILVPEQPIPAGSGTTPSISRAWHGNKFVVRLPREFYNKTDVPAPYNELSNGDRVDITVTIYYRPLTGGNWVTVGDLSQTETHTRPGATLGDAGVSVYSFEGVPAQTEIRVEVVSRSRSNATGSLSSTTWFGTPTRNLNLWAERAPTPPTITSPPNNATLSYGTGAGNSTTLTWQVNDPDRPNPTDGDYWGWEVEYRPAPTATNPNPTWQPATKVMPVWPNFVSGSLANVTALSIMLRGGAAATTPGFTVPSPGAYQFRVQTRDLWAVYNGTFIANRGLASGWSLPVTVVWNGPWLPPLPISPTYDQAHIVGDVRFEWKFRDPRPTGGTQLRRELRIRPAGGDVDSWFPVISNLDPASANEFFVWTNSEALLVPGRRYEWQVRTTSTPGNYLSSWSESAFFWTVPDPGSGEVIPVPEQTVPDDGLGTGNNRVFVYDRGGNVVRGEIVHKELVRWHRKRDDLSSMTVRIDGWDDEDIPMLADLRTWMHELVVFREVEGQQTRRVWEGPITRITYGPDYIEFEAHDVLAYIYRRILRQGWNDAYRKDGSGLTTITLRAAQIIQNALAYDDPNVLPYLQIRLGDDDATQSRVVPDYSMSAFEAVDSLAATAGLDYTAAGRRIIVWDTHDPIGRLIELRNGDFDNDLLVTEYGMRLANVYGISNNQGVYGVAERPVDAYGYVEMVDSAYGETDAGGLEETLTEAARIELQRTLAGQAERAIASRYPAPLVARVPDNSRLMPHVQLGINQLIPGVFVPLRVDHPIRPFTQLQKIDSVTVEQIGSEETVKLVLSPAPRNRDDDPDDEMEV